MQKSIALAAACLIGTTIQTSPARAYDMDCKVILCLAGGFPQGCSDAHSYMMRRLKKGKGPFGTCTSGSAIDGGYRVPVKMFIRKIKPVCLAWETDRDGRHCTSIKPGRKEGVIRISIPQDGALQDYKNDYVWWSRAWDPNDDLK